MYINYDFQVKLPTNALFKNLKEIDFADFYQKSIATKIDDPKPLLSVWIQTRKVKQVKTGFTFINFFDDSFDDSYELEPIVKLNAFECKEVEQLKQKYVVEQTYQNVLKEISREWQDFLIAKFGFEYKTLLAEHEAKRLERLSDLPDINEEQLNAEFNNFIARFGDVIGKQV